MQGLVDLLILLTANEIHPISALIIDYRPERGGGGGGKTSLFSAFLLLSFYGVEESSHAGQGVEDGWGRGTKRRQPLFAEWMDFAIKSPKKLVGIYMLINDFWCMTKS